MIAAGKALRDAYVPLIVEQLRSEYPFLGTYTDEEVEQFWLTGMKKESA